MHKELPSQESSKVIHRASDEGKSGAPGNAWTIRNQRDGRKQLWPQDGLWKEELCAPSPAKEYSIRVIPVGEEDAGQFHALRLDAGHVNPAHPAYKTGSSPDAGTGQKLLSRRKQAGVIPCRGQKITE